MVCKLYLMGVSFENSKPEYFLMKIGPKMESNVTCSFQENMGNLVQIQFIPYLIHSRPLNWQMFLHYLLPHDNITIPSQAQNITQCITCMYEAIAKYVMQGPWCVVQGIKRICVQNFTSFLKLVTEFCPSKKQVSFLSILPSTIVQMPEYIGKATSCTFYGIS